MLERYCIAYFLCLYSYFWNSGVRSAPLFCKTVTIEHNNMSIYMAKAKQHSYSKSKLCIHKLFLHELLHLLWNRDSGMCRFGTSLPCGDLLGTPSHTVKDRYRLILLWLRRRHLWDCTGPFSGDSDFWCCVGNWKNHGKFIRTLQKSWNKRYYFILFYSMQGT